MPPRSDFTSDQITKSCCGSAAQAGGLGIALTLVLPDDHPVLRQALRALLERRGLEVVADEADGQAAVAAVQRFAPDVAILDVAMPVLNGVDAAREIQRIAPDCTVILLSGVDDARFVREALKAGLRGFVQKSQCADDLVDAIEEERDGRLYVSPGASQAIVDVCATAEEEEGAHLPPRQRQVPPL